MRTLTRFTLLTVYLLCNLCMTAQPVCHVARYTEDSGLAQWHVTQMLQDTDGMIWFSTWNGLDRFDGCNFTNFKSDAGDKCVMPTDRIRNIMLNKSGELVCKTDEGWYLFNRRTGEFSLSEKPQVYGSAYPRGTRVKQFPVDFRDKYGVLWRIGEDGSLSYCDGSSFVTYPVDEPFRELLNIMEDRQHNLWLMLKGGVVRLSFARQKILDFHLMPAALPGCFYVDSQHRYWVGTKDDGVLRVYDKSNNLLGYMGRDGLLHNSYTLFGSPIYRITQTSEGTFWIGSKPDGLLRLREQQGRFTIDHFSKVKGFPLPCNDVYDIVEDSHHRLWIATMGGGLCCMLNPRDESPTKIVRFIERKKYPSMREHRVRFIYITSDQKLLAATTEGLLVGDVSGADLSRMTFRLHRKEAERGNSLSSNATMDVLEMPGGRFFVSTESGGVNEILTKDLLAETLEFRHYDRHCGLPSDITLALSRLSRDEILIVGSNVLMTLNITDGTTGSYDTRFFNRPCRFAESCPIQLPDGRWIFGFHNGAFTMSGESFYKSTYAPSLVVTRVSVNGADRFFHLADELTLQPDERNLTISFAALDYTALEGVNYAYRLNDGKWMYLGDDHMVSFVDLSPGTYTLQVRSTNGDGEWGENITEIKITVLPYFFETILGKILLWLLALSVIGGVVYTYLYIRRINRQRHETLEAYLALIAEGAKERENDGLRKPENDDMIELESEVPKVASISRSPEDEAFMARVMDYVERHIGDADANVVDMAAEAATSKSGLNRKMKSIVGLTPADFIREARIKRACKLLLDTTDSVADIAYHCGFTDPKYFGKCFKASVGMSPSDYRN